MKTHQQRAIHWREESRDSLNVQDMDQLIDGSIGRPRAKRLIRHLDHGDFIAGTLDHPIQFGLLTTFLRRLQSVGARLQMTRYRDRQLNVFGQR